jgi:hypothetical protein
MVSLVYLFFYKYFLIFIIIIFYKKKMKRILCLSHIGPYSEKTDRLIFYLIFYFKMLCKVYIGS